MPEKSRNYIPDFILPNGIVIEFKGKLDRTVREKMALVFEQNPDLDIRLVFMRNNKISKTSKTRYSDWCDKRGIKYHVSEEGKIPDEWITEALTSSSLDGAASVQPAQKRRSKSSVRVSGRGLDAS